jgi:hypothetical protein
MTMVKLSSNLWKLGKPTVFAKSSVSYLSPNIRFFSYLAPDARQATAHNPEIYQERPNGTGEFPQTSSYAMVR